MVHLLFLRKRYRLPNASSTSRPSDDALFGAGETLSTCHISRTLHWQDLPRALQRGTFNIPSKERNSQALGGCLWIGFTR
eukprot:scaffold3727_cov348-Pavlova_lutheri.AAC.1